MVDTESIIPDVNILSRPLPRSALRWELLFVTLVLWLGLISVPLLLGEMGLSWDTLNHHIYLGWTAGEQRFDQDFLAAGSQVYQFPYLYWPAYRLAVDGWSGVGAGIVLNSLHALAIPPVWLLALACIPGQSPYDIVMRFLAVVLAFLSGVIISLLATTANDLLAAIPLVWAFALAVESLNPGRTSWFATHTAILLSGLLGGVSVAFKLSNGPLVILLPGLWFLLAQPIGKRVQYVLIGSLATLLGFGLTYGYWGYLLWQHYGNPIYPFYDTWFDPLRHWLRWRP